MPERKTSPEIAEVWDGHHFEDGCSWRNESPRPIDYVKAVAIFPRLMGELYGNMLARDRILYNELQAFLAMEPTAPLKRISVGQKFDPAEYQPGTILTISKDQFFENFQSAAYDMWGVVSQEWQPDKKSKNVVVGFPKHHIKENIRSAYGGYRNWHDIFIVDEVIHDKVKEFPFYRNQKLTRYGTVEIWKFGLADPAKNPAFAPSLKPSTQRR